MINLEGDTVMPQAPVDNDLLATLFHLGLITGTALVFLFLAVGVHLLNILIASYKEYKNTNK